MRSKLLFVMGILLAHGALGAAWIKQDAPQSRVSLATCVNTPLPMPQFFQPQREPLLAHVVSMQSEVQAQP
jgi:hypothetical protein